MLLISNMFVNVIVCIGKEASEYDIQYGTTTDIAVGGKLGFPIKTPPL